MTWYEGSLTTRCLCCFAIVSNSKLWYVGLLALRGSSNSALASDELSGIPIEDNQAIILVFLVHLHGAMLICTEFMLALSVTIIKHRGKYGNISTTKHCYKRCKSFPNGNHPNY